MTSVYLNVINTNPVFGGYDNLYLSFKLQHTSSQCHVGNIELTLRFLIYMYLCLNVCLNKETTSRIIS